MKCSFLDYVHFWWSAWLVNGLKAHPSPLSSQKNEMLIFRLCSLLMISLAGQWTQTPSAIPLQPKNEMLIFGLHSTSDDRPGWSMDSNPICHPSPDKKWNAHFLDYIQLLIISWAGWWTQTPSSTPLQPKKWNACLWIMFNFWWSARLVNGLEPHPPPLSSQKNEMLIFRLHSTSDVGQAGQWTRTPSATPLQPKKWKAHFWIMFNFWCWPGWLMDLNPIQTPSPAKKMKCSFLDYVQLLMIGRAGLWTQTPSATPLQPKKMKCSFLDYVHFWWSA